MAAVQQNLDGILDHLPDPSSLFPLLIPNGIKIHFDWKPEVQPWSFPAGTDPIFAPKDPKNTFVASVLFELKFDGSEPKLEVYAGLKNIDIYLLPAVMNFLHLKITELSFSMKVGKKADITANLDEPEFVGAFSFVKKLADVLGSNGAGFADPPAIEVTKDGITAGFDVGLPNITIGVMSIQNIALGAHLNLPFIGDPLNFHFNFCERDAPFILTVWIFGGGGFFGIGVDPDGLEMLEASFEFGATFCIDLGVASGEAHLMAGIYFKMEGTSVSLTGFVKLGGHLSILGIIHASVEFDLSLTYQFDTGKMWGTASLSIEISVFMFSFSVSVSVTKQFKGSTGDPTIYQMLSHEDWSAYCDAFAA
jgi:hypothetical protein